MTQEKNRLACVSCGRELAAADQAAVISGSIMGDECTDAYYRCPGCGLYTVAHWRDCFGGEETVSLSGPLAAADGEHVVAVIRPCPEPWDKKCRCPAHRAHFGDWLD